MTAAPSAAVASGPGSPPRSARAVGLELQRQRAHERMRARRQPRQRATRAPGADVAADEPAAGAADLDELMVRAVGRALDLDLGARRREHEPGAIVRGVRAHRERQRAGEEQRQVDEVRAEVEQRVVAALHRAPRACGGSAAPSARQLAARRYLAHEREALVEAAVEGDPRRRRQRGDPQRARGVGRRRLLDERRQPGRAAAASRPPREARPACRR